MKNRLQRQSGSAMVVILIIVVIAIIGAIIWVWLAGTNTENNNGNGDEQSNETTIEGTYFAAIAAGDPLECSWTLNSQEDALLSTGVLYTDGADRGLSEASFVNEGESETTDSLTLIDTESVYSWVIQGEGALGTQISRADIEGQEPNTETIGTSQTVDVNANYTFTCQPWTVDESKFVVPENVTFLPS